MKEKITQITGSIRKDLVGFLREIIAIPSMNGHEEAVIQRIKAEMHKIGYDKVWIDPLGNLMGMIGSGERIIALDGHCDTVGIGNTANWQCDPFKGDYRDQIIYGRGACDQKGGLASAIYAGKVLKETGIPAGISVLVVASVLEEDYEGLCWHYILKNSKIKPEAVLLTEPSNLQIKIGQRGRIEVKVQTKGISCHSSAPDRGENAIYKIAPIIQEIEQLNKKLQSPSLLGRGTITISEVCSTTPSLCAVADSATIHIDRRLTEGDTLDDCLSEIKNLPSVKAANAQVTMPEYNVKSYTGIVYPFKAYFPMWLMETDHPLIQKATQAYEKQFAQKAPVGVWDFSTNGIAIKGMFDIPTIGFGPGREEFAHKPDEQIHENDLIKAVEFYAAFIHAYNGK
ncbi:MAG: YgeY family selenium metabolism-linked hydrolase [Acidobacteria bacterium]|jgi:putative selenium metabolism hydrolase|nr:YgeY family selenium metabolism-linked hydrolase [Acidobacteriota bacterium]